MCHLCARRKQGKKNAPAGTVAHLNHSCRSVVTYFFFIFFMESLLCSVSDRKHLHLKCHKVQDSAV